MTQSIQAKTLAKIRRNGRSWAFSHVDFAGIGSRDAIDKALERLQREGTIRRVIRGIYDFPDYSKLLDKSLGPDIYQVSRALARKFGWRIQPDGASALNLMRVSTQVPARYVFQSDGPTRTYEIGSTQVRFVHKATKEMNFECDETAVITHGLKSLGSEHVDDSVIAKIRRWLPEDRRSKVLHDSRRVTGWVHEAIRKTCEEGSDGLRILEQQINSAVKGQTE
ncbi:DUF6088 family protein [Allorhodopirellula solitaria]|uniref:AbiEi antitoxin C-terminal domain-containing protein n=1 Tax=Allorhodopirellula solitaria TaxID=2527987 RepID=A0A5C5YHN4_9BACT|nr:DUF6088 family protein [Allorhodopirellula solitaria]TWT74355.1 hypothetical protein CA85_12430 [Allorhodopirellula solitaria]